MAVTDFSGDPDFGVASTKQHRQTVVQLLSLHEKDASFLAFLRMHVPWFVWRYTPAISVCLFLYNFEMKEAVPAVVGLVIWLFCLDVFQCRALARFWTVYERIIDWDKARKLAEGR